MDVLLKRPNKRKQKSKKTKENVEAVPGSAKEKPNTIGKLVKRRAAKSARSKRLKTLSIEEELLLQSLNNWYENIDKNVPEESLTEEQKVIKKLKTIYENEDLKEKPFARKPKDQLAISKPLLDSVFLNPKLEEIAKNPNVRTVEVECFHVDSPELRRAPYAKQPRGKSEDFGRGKNSNFYRSKSYDDLRLTGDKFDGLGPVLYRCAETEDLTRESPLRCARESSVAPSDSASNQRYSDFALVANQPKNAKDSVNFATLDVILSSIPETAPEHELTGEQKFALKLKEAMDEAERKRTLRKLAKAKKLPISSPTIESVRRNAKLRQILNDPRIKSIRRRSSVVEASPTVDGAVLRQSKSYEDITFTFDIDAIKMNSTESFSKVGRSSSTTTESFSSAEFNVETGSTGPCTIPGAVDELTTLATRIEEAEQTHDVSENAETGRSKGGRGSYRDDSDLTYNETLSRGLKQEGATENAPTREEGVEGIEEGNSGKDDSDLTYNETLSRVSKREEVAGAGVGVGEEPSNDSDLTYNETLSRALKHEGTTSAAPVPDQNIKVADEEAEGGEGYRKCDSALTESSKREPEASLHTLKFNEALKATDGDLEKDENKSGGYVESDFEPMQLKENYTEINDVSVLEKETETVTEDNEIELTEYHNVTVEPLPQSPIVYTYSTVYATRGDGFKILDDRLLESELEGTERESSSSTSSEYDYHDILKENRYGVVSPLNIRMSYKDVVKEIKRKFSHDDSWESGQEEVDSAVKIDMEMEEIFEKYLHIPLSKVITQGPHRQAEDAKPVEDATGAYQKMDLTVTEVEVGGNDINHDSIGQDVQSPDEITQKPGEELNCETSNEAGNVEMENVAQNLHQTVNLDDAHNEQVPSSVDCTIVTVKTESSDHVLPDVVESVNRNVQRGRGMENLEKIETEVSERHSDLTEEELEVVRAARRHRLSRPLSDFNKNDLQLIQQLSATYLPETALQCSDRQQETREEFDDSITRENESSLEIGGKLQEVESSPRIGLELFATYFPEATKESMWEVVTNPNEDGQHLQVVQEEFIAYLPDATLQAVSHQKYESETVSDEFGDATVQRDEDVEELEVREVAIVPSMYELPAPRYDYSTKELGVAGGLSTTYFLDTPQTSIGEHQESKGVNFEFNAVTNELQVQELAASPNEDEVSGFDKKDSQSFRELPATETTHQTPVGQHQMYESKAVIFEFTTITDGLQVQELAASSNEDQVSGFNEKDSQSFRELPATETTQQAASSQEKYENENGNHQRTSAVIPEIEPDVEQILTRLLTRRDPWRRNGRKKLTEVEVKNRPELFERRSLGVVADYEPVYANFGELTGRRPRPVGARVEKKPLPVPRSRNQEGRPAVGFGTAAHVKNDSCLTDSKMTELKENFRENEPVEEHPVLNSKMEVAFPGRYESPRLLPEGATREVLEDEERTPGRDVGIGKSEKFLDGKRASDEVNVYAAEEQNLACGAGNSLSSIAIAGKFERLDLTKRSEDDIKEVTSGNESNLNLFHMETPSFDESYLNMFRSPEEKTMDDFIRRKPVKGYFNVAYLGEASVSESFDVEGLEKTESKPKIIDFVPLDDATKPVFNKTNLDVPTYDTLEREKTFHVLNSAASAAKVRQAAPKIESNDSGASLKSGSRTSFQAAKKVFEALLEANSESTSDQSKNKARFVKNKPVNKKEDDVELGNSSKEN